MTGPRGTGAPLFVMDLSRVEVRKGLVWLCMGVGWIGFAVAMVARCVWFVRRRMIAVFASEFVLVLCFLWML